MAKTAKATRVKAETPETKIAEISKEIVKVEKNAQTVAVIKSQEDYEDASKFLSEVVKPRVNRVKELMEFFTKPHREARAKALEEIRKIETMFEKSLAPLTAVEGTVKKAMGGYLRQKDEEARKEEERLAANRAKQDERREEKGLEPIATPLPTVARPETVIKTDTGAKTAARKVWKFEITDVQKMYGDSQFMEALFNYCVENGIHEKVARKMMNAGIRKVEGVRFYEDYDVSATASKF